MSTDKYDDQRFRSVCPTCGQNFLVERVDLLTALLQRVLEYADDGTPIHPSDNLINDVRATLDDTKA